MWLLLLFNSESYLNFKYFLQLYGEYYEKSYKSEDLVCGTGTLNPLFFWLAQGRLVSE